MSDGPGGSSAWVLDASAVLALLQDEVGADEVETRLSGAAISAVNLSEVAAKLADAGMPEGEAKDAVDALGLTVIPFDAALAWTAAALRPVGKSLGLSLGDRACLGTGLALSRSVLGADRAWSKLALPIHVQLIR